MYCQEAEFNYSTINAMKCVK